MKTSQGTIHKVVAKETLFSIARLYNVTVDDIKTWNNLSDGTLSVGQDIIIKNKLAVEATVTKSVPVSSAKTHTVLEKETLFSISRLYGMTVKQLMDLNNMQKPELKVGQVLTVLASTPSGVATTTTATTVVPVIKTESAVTVSESVAGTDEIRESGFAELIEGTEGNRKYLAQHPTVKPGTILKIRNLSTYQEVFVRVTGPPSTTTPETIIRISKSAYDRLGATEAKFRAEITYYK